MDVLVEIALPEYLARLDEQHKELLGRLIANNEVINRSEACYLRRVGNEQDPARFRAILED